MTERLTGISGSMFSGKTDELIRLCRRARYARKNLQVFKPLIDNRWNKTDKLASHSENEFDATPVSTSLEIIDRLEENTKLVAIDEIQFFDKEIVGVIEEMLNRKIEVIFSGLPTDFRGEPFGSVPVLLSKCDYITKLTAICDYILENGETCGENATRTQRTVNGKPANYNDEVVQVGGKETYAARCPTHHIVPGKPKNPTWIIILNAIL